MPILPYRARREGVTNVTPWQRALRATGLVVALGAGAVVSPYGSVPSYGAVLAYDYEAQHGDETKQGDETGHGDETGAGAGAGDVPSARGEPSRAGSRAGEGRERPGRPGRPEEADTGADDSTAVPEEPPETLPVPPAQTEEPVRDAAAARGERPVGPVLRILPLGSGLVLIGLGLGLAFFALRLRRS
ncbi:hypothetical protein GCM10023086_23970 [Streptomyces venetus]|uniref:Uncharacterized protein n=1 Tax=Streptomyces venetus TaxID=1701086 RepID=A0ABP8FKJ4_9ACTN